MRKLISLVVLITLYTTSVAGQQNEEEIKVITEIIKRTTDAPPIIYITDVKGMGDDDRLATKISKGSFYIREGDYENIEEGVTIYAGRNIDSLILTKKEIELIISKLKIPTHWKQNLLPNSIATKNFKEAVDTVRKLNEENKTEGKRFYYSFTKPIFLRNNTICFVASLAMGNRGCGSIVSAFYKKVNNVWEQWIFVSGGDF